MNWDNRYRMLQHGEIIEPGDERDVCRDPWRDDPVWVPAPSGDIGTAAPDPKYVSHRRYRRLAEEARK